MRSICFNSLMMFAILWLTVMVDADEAKPPSPRIALNFENPDHVKKVFGETGKAEPGLRGSGIGGGYFRLTLDTVPVDRGTVMIWLKALPRPPAGSYQYRWLKIDSTQVGPMGATLIPGWHGTSLRSVTPSCVELGDWRHWACVWDGKERRIYLDGQLVAQGTGKPFAKPLKLNLVFVDYGYRVWIGDDLKIYDQALTADEVMAARNLAVAHDLLPQGTNPESPVEVPAPMSPPPVVFGDRQMVENPCLAPYSNSFKINSIPKYWECSKGKNRITTNANGAVLAPADEPVSLLASMKRGLLVPGQVYRLGLYYRLNKGEGRAILRFRNQIDMDTKEFELKPQDWGRSFFYAVAPEDYDVGLYFLELVVEGKKRVLDLRAVYCREATPDEVKKADLKVGLLPVKLPPSVTPDERWIESIPSTERFLSPPNRQAAWSDGEKGTPLRIDLAKEGDSVWFGTPPRKLFDNLVNLKKNGATIPRLSVTRARKDVPGGNGLDPLPARSAHGAALLFGVGAMDSGCGTYAFKQLRGLLEKVGYFDESTRFIPFWQGKGFYTLRYDHREKPVDFRKVFNNSDEKKAESPLFGFTAPGVLVSGYQNGNKLLLVVVNTTDQALGKCGDLWVNHRRVFGLKQKLATLARDGILTIVDMETGVKGSVAYDRKNRGYLDDIWVNIAIEPGDYRLFLLEVHNDK